MTGGDGGRDAACAAAWRKYPALAGVAPTARRDGDGQVFTFRATRATGAGPALSLVVRVSVGPDGRVRRIVAGR